MLAVKDNTEVLGTNQLAWCRDKITGFSILEQHALIARGEFIEQTKKMENVTKVKFT